MDHRLYSFQNFYFAGIHAGIQTAHSVARMSQKYPQYSGSDEAELFTEWAERGAAETIIVKNGGMAGDIENFIEFMKRAESTLGIPWDYFNESEYAANGATTNLSMVVPEWLWKLADTIRSGLDVVFTNEATGESYVFFDEDGKVVDLGPKSAGTYTIPTKETIQRTFERTGVVKWLWKLADTIRSGPKSASTSHVTYTIPTKETIQRTFERTGVVKLSTFESRRVSGDALELIARMNRCHLM